MSGNLLRRVVDTSEMSTPTKSHATQSQHFRPDAPTFSPGRNRNNGVFYHEGDDEYVNGEDKAAMSPIPPNHTTFQIPDTPTPPPYATAFNATVAHTRGRSDIVDSHPLMPNMYDLPIRPRSRSDLPVSPSAPQDARSDDHPSGVSSLSRSTLSSDHPSGLAAPSPQRHLYPDSNIHAMPWSRSPGPTQHMSRHSLSGLAGNGHAHPAKLNSTNGNVQAIRMPTILDEDRATPGGVKLPMASDGHAHDPFTSTELASTSATIGASSGLRRSKTVGHYSSSGPSSVRYGNGSVENSNLVNTKSTEVERTVDGSSVEASQNSSHRNSLVTPQTPQTPKRTAKDWADFIMNGGCESPASTPQRSSVRQTPMSTPGPSVLTHPLATHVPHVMPQIVPYMNEPDPVVRSFIDQGRPPYAVLAAHFPMEASVNVHGPSIGGVIKITDIPYSTTRQEVVAFFGRNARFMCQPAGSPYYAIHIIMERSTAKSMDCFIEFETDAEASLAYDRTIRQQNFGHRRPRIGDRIVSVHLSSQEELMKEVFPRAKCVRWQGQHPTEVAPEFPFNSGFQGFITAEEMHMVVKFANNPNRSRFAAKHVQRTYESMISTLNKYPWWAAELYSIAERDRVFNAARDLTAELAGYVRNNAPHTSLTSRLLEELLVVGLDCPGFAENQRAELVDASTFFVGVPRFVSSFAKAWPFEILRRRTDVSEELVKYYVAILHEQSLYQNPSAPQYSNFGAFPFGTLHMLLAPHDPDMKVSQVVNNEWHVLTTLIKYGSGTPHAA